MPEIPQPPPDTVPLPPPQHPVPPSPEIPPEINEPVWPGGGGSPGPEPLQPGQPIA